MSEMKTIASILFGFVSKAAIGSFSLGGRTGGWALNSPRVLQRYLPLSFFPHHHPLPPSTYFDDVAGHVYLTLFLSSYRLII